MAAAPPTAGATATWTGTFSWQASYPLNSSPSSVQAPAHATVLSGDPMLHTWPAELSLVPAPLPAAFERRLARHRPALCRVASTGGREDARARLLLQFRFLCRKRGLCATTSWVGPTGQQSAALLVPTPEDAEFLFLAAVFPAGGLHAFMGSEDGWAGAGVGDVGAWRREVAKAQGEPPGRAR